MRCIAILASIALMAQHAALARVVRHSGLPQAYWGTWATDADKCGTGDKSAIVFSAKSYSGPGASCDIDYVSETAGAHGPIYSARLLCSDATGNAKNRSVLNVIIRPDDGDRISVGSTFDSLVAYRRCPAGGASDKPK
jgi:hypothetical protein